MKEKLKMVLQKAKELLSKVNRKTVTVAASVLVIGLAVLLNFLLLGNGDDDSLKPAVDLSDLSSGNGEGDAGAEGADAATPEDYFATMALSRQQARDEAMEVLQGVMASEDAVEDMKTGAMEDLRRMAGEIEVEANIESLIMSKGFEQCVAVINGDTASVVVKSEGLLPNEISQISEIVYEQAGVLPTNLNIIEKN